MTGYFGGYIAKRQKIGNFELKKSVSTLPLLKEKLEARAPMTGSAQLAHVVNRMFTTLEGKGHSEACAQELCFIGIGSKLAPGVFLWHTT